MLVIIFTAAAKMNIKGSNENALLNNFTPQDIENRKAGRLASDKSAGDPSNDEAALRNHAFNTSLKAKECDSFDMMRVGFGVHTAAGFVDPFTAVVAADKVTKADNL